MSYTELGYLQSSNAVAQFIAVPFMGALSDKYGRKPLLIISIFGTIVSFYLFATANSVTMLFASRILDGLLGGNISLAHSYISGKFESYNFSDPFLTLLLDVTEEKDRTKSMGVIGAAFGIGFIVGPPIGGLLSQYDYAFPSYVALGLSVLNLFSVVFFLKESLPVELRSQKIMESSYISSFKDSLYESVHNAPLQHVLWKRFLFMVSFTIFELWIGLFTSDILNLRPREGNLYLFWFGLVYSMASGFIRVLVKRYDERNILVASLVVLATFNLVVGLTTNLFVFALYLVPLGLASGICSTIISSDVSKKTNPALKGGTLGISSALGSMSRIIAPNLNSFTTQWLNLSAPTVLCGVLCIYLAYLSYMPVSKKINK